MKVVAKKKGAGRYNRTPRVAAKGSSAPAASTQPATAIVVLEEAFGFGYDVKISSPADGDNRCREFQDHGHAMAFAGVLRLEFGFPIVDRSGERS